MAHLKNKHQGFTPNDVNRQNNYTTCIPKLIEEGEEEKERQRKQKEKTSRDNKRRNDGPDMQECVGLEVEIPADLLNFCLIFLIIICVF